MPNPIMPTVVVLAGGVSSRLWPLREKALIEFSGEPLLTQQLRSYARLGFSDVLLVCNPQNHRLLEDQARIVSDLKVETFIQTEAKGMGDALLLLREHLSRNNNPPIYVTQVHDIFDSSLHAQMLDAYEHGAADSLLAAKSVESYFPGGYLVIESDRIIGIEEKPEPGKEPSQYVTFVAHLHREPLILLDEIEQQYSLAIASDDHYERAMAHLMQTRTYRPVVFHGHWCAIKYPWHVLEAMKYFLDSVKEVKIAPSAIIDETARIFGPVVIEEDVRIMPGSQVVGPTFIGAGTIIGNNALVRSSMLGRACVVGFSTEVARSYVGNNVEFHMSYVGDSVIDDGVRFGAGAITANLRHDDQTVKSMVKGRLLDTGLTKFGTVAGQGARIGVNTNIFPGRKIGLGAFVGPGVGVCEDVSDNTQVFARQELKTIVRPLPRT